MSLMPTLIFYITSVWALGDKKQNPMKKTKTVIAVFAATILIALTGCKKGDTGPAGKDGKDGNANVISSNTVTITNWNVDYQSTTDFTYSNTLSWATITQAVVDKGVVMAYMQNGTTEWVALPYSDAGSTGGSYSLAFNYYVALGTCKIEITGFDSGGAPAASSYNGLVVRLVCIPASQLAANPGKNWKNYSDLKKEFNLPD